MNQTTSTTLDGPHAACPTRRIEVELPLSTIEEIDNLANLNHLDRPELLRQIISAALVGDAPGRPDGPHPAERLAEHAYLTRIRSSQLAAEAQP